MEIKTTTLLDSAPEGYYWEKDESLICISDKPRLMLGGTCYLLHPQQRAVDWDMVSPGVTLRCDDASGVFYQLRGRSSAVHDSVMGISTEHWVRSDMCPFDESTCEYETYDAPATVTTPETTFWRFTGLKENCVYGIQ